MTKVSDKYENPQIYSTGNPFNNSGKSSNGKLFLYNGSYKPVFRDDANGGKEYILDENGKKKYIFDIAILQMKNTKEKLISSFDEQKSQYEKWKNHWLSKLNLANAQYKEATLNKKTAYTGYQTILAQTGCKDLAGVKEYVQVNGGNYYNEAKAFNEERTDARSAQISSEAMALFYGRMYVDESYNVANIDSQKLIALNLLT